MTMIGYDILPLSVPGLAGVGTGDKATIVIPPGRWILERSFVVWAGASAHATAAVIAFDTVRGATRGAGDAGIIKKTASVNEIGKMTYWKPSTATSVDVELSGGDLVVVEATTAQGEALTFAAGIVLKQMPEAQVNLTQEVLTAV